MRRLLPMVVSLSIAIALTSSFAAPAPAACPGTCIYLPAVAGPAPVILPNSSVYPQRGSGNLQIVGEVQNPTGITLEYITVGLQVLNGADFVETQGAFTYLEQLQSGDKTCFHFALEGPLTWTSYRFELLQYFISTDPGFTLTLSNVHSLIDSGGGYHILGRVRNDSDVRVPLAKLIGTLYSATGTVLDCNYAYATSALLDPGQTSTFDVPFLDRASYTNVASYRVQVEGTGTVIAPHAGGSSPSQYRASRSLDKALEPPTRFSLVSEYSGGHWGSGQGF